MKIKINEKLICIPPYVSATWDQVTFLETKEDERKNLNLVIHLMDGKEVWIPHLDNSLIETAFSSHLKHLESGARDNSSKGSNKPLGGFIQQLTGLSMDQLNSMPIRLGISGLPGIEGMEMAFQHNSSQADSPDMPSDILEKISSFAKMVSGGDLSAFPKPEPHCNCMHCQVARAVHGIQKEDSSDQEPATEEDLKFKSWDIFQNGENLYIVSNPLDPEEKYQVYLGKPVGCTCGEPHCEHIHAVLYS